MFRAQNISQDSVSNCSCSNSSRTEIAGEIFPPSVLHLKWGIYNGRGSKAPIDVSLNILMAATISTTFKSLSFKTFQKLQYKACHIFTTF